MAFSKNSQDIGFNSLAAANEENEPKIQLRGWGRAPTIFRFGESFSLKSLKNEYVDSLFNFKLAYFVV